MHGKWLVIEDVNLAPPDVLAALIPLLDSQELRLSHRAQSIRAAPGFQLLATVTCSPGKASHCYSEGMTWKHQSKRGGNHCDRLSVCLW